jgi:hypothetical protein
LARVCTCKQNDSGSIKAKLISQGFTRNAGLGVDCNRAPAAVSKWAMFKTLLAWVAAKDVELHQLDIKAANLNDDLQGKV